MADFSKRPEVTVDTMVRRSLEQIGRFCYGMSLFDWARWYARTTEIRRMQQGVQGLASWSYVTVSV